MTAREYAKKCGVELVGKLTKKVDTYKEFDYYKGEFVIKKTVYYEDEIGNQLNGAKGHWCLITVDGDVY